MKRKWYIILLVLTQTQFLISQNPVDSILQTRKYELKSFIPDYSKYGLQVVFTTVKHIPGKKNPALTTYAWGTKNNYFYPASLIKFPLALLAIEKIQRLDSLGIDLFSPLLFDAGCHCQKEARTDTTSKNHYPSVGHYIKKIMLVSDNDAYNRLYEFVTPCTAHEQLITKGMNNIRIVHRFLKACNDSMSLCTNPFKIIKPTGEIAFEQSQQTCEQTFKHPLGTVLVGKGYMNKQTLIKKPKDFSNLNYLPLEDAHRMLVELIYPPDTSLFNIHEEYRKQLIRWMGMYPQESKFPKYDSSIYFPAYKKYLLAGNQPSYPMNKNLRIVNIVGQSYGFLSDVAYIADISGGNEFFLSAAVYVNDDGILNDDKYDYKTRGFPFLKILGEIFYQHIKVHHPSDPSNLDWLKELFNHPEN